MESNFKYLRVPARLAAAYGLTATVPCLPVGDIPRGPDFIFAIRLSKPFQSTPAIIINERYYVLQALRAAEKAYCIECPGHDPLLVMKGFSNIEKALTDVAVEFLSLPQLDVALDELPDDTKFMAVQLVGTLPADHLVHQYPMAPFKHFHLVPFHKKEKVLSFSQSKLTGCFNKPYDCPHFEQFCYHDGNSVCGQELDSV